ncbi:MAG: aldolase [Oscillibacter sp.]|jgi:ribulose-5-phosphate 4-epimerase/fuculose-1-phosphate aldolase|nr:aldolase [Oscillibacter sp.]
MDGKREVSYAEERRARQELVKWGKELYDQGLVKGSGGNLSIRLKDGTVLMTPTGWFLGHMTEECVSHITMEGTLLDGEAPTKEVPLHLAVYQERPNVCAVCHTHSLYATAYASSVEDGAVMPVYVPSLAAKVGPVQVTSFALPGSEQLGENVRTGIRSSNGTLLSNHGVVAVGKDMAAAVSAANEIENNAMLHFISGQTVKPIPRDAVETLYRKVPL